MYKDEAAFRKALCGKLAQYGWFTQKIESEGMNSGIPDLFIGKDYIQNFLELKLEKTDAPVYPADIKVHWRPGQQAWANKYYRSVKKCVLTVIQYNNLLAVVPTGRTIFKGNTVPFDTVIWYTGIQEFVLSL